MNPYFRDIFVTTLTCAGVAGSLRGDVDLRDRVGHVRRDPHEQGQDTLQATVAKNSGQ